MRRTLAFALIWINFFITGSIIFFFVLIRSERPHLSKYHSYNLRGTNEKSLNYKESSKELRILEAGGKEFLILYLDIAAFFFIIFLMTSFCFTKNECCTSVPTLLLLLVVVMVIVFVVTIVARDEIVILSVVVKIRVMKEEGMV